MCFIGCGSPAHILPDSLCKSTLNQIHTNPIIAYISPNQDDAMARIYFRARTVHNVAAARPSSTRTNPKQIGPSQQELITVETDMSQSQPRYSRTSSVNEMRYVNIANELCDSDEKQMMSTQIYTAFVTDASISDTGSDSKINCTYIVIDTFNIFQYRSEAVLCRHWCAFFRASSRKV